MRILVLITDAFGGYGGIAKFNRDVLTSLCAHPDCTEVVAIPRIVPNPYGPLPLKLTYITRGLNGKLSYIVTTIKNVIAKRRFDFIICAHVNLIPLAMMVKQLVKRPVVLLVHGIDAWQPTKSALTNRLVRNIDAFISVSDLTKERFLGWTKLDSGKGFILPNSVNRDLFEPGEKSIALLDRYGLSGKTVLMTLGRLVSKDRYKGFDEMLELMPALTREIPNVVYVVAGDGPDSDRLQQKAKSLGVHEHTVFTGLIPEKEKADHYRLADVFVMPSRCEGFGIVLLEAMACGIPVIASKIDGGREAVRGGKFGKIVDPDNPDEIKATILESLERPKGVVPEGLDFFSFGNFNLRCHRIIDRIREGT